MGSTNRDTCSECGKEFNMAHGGRREPQCLCGPCNKRLNWRPANGAAVDRDRAASRRWKRAHLPAKSEGRS